MNEPEKILQRNGGKVKQMVKNDLVGFVSTYIHISLLRVICVFVV